MTRKQMWLLINWASWTILFILPPLLVLFETEISAWIIMSIIAVGGITIISLPRKDGETLGLAHLFKTLILDTIMEAWRERGEEKEADNPNIHWEGYEE